MTTAKPQQNNDQPDAADDLIAELTKLMAQDAQTGDRERTPPPTGSGPAAKPFSFRLPGDADPRPAPAAEKNELPRPQFDFSAGRQSEPAPAPAEPFKFDFDAPTRKPEAPAETPPPVDSDALGDLIAAELAADIGSHDEEAPPAPARPPEPPAPRSERGTDSFKVAPVFGLAGPASPMRPVTPERADPERVAPIERAPEPTPAEQTNDPINEIESLIGEAVRVQAEQPQVAAAAATPSPSLRSLATPVLPREPQAPQKSAAPEPIETAEDAILAAAAATGARVGWIDPGQEGGETFDDERQAAPRRRRAIPVRAFAGPALAVVLLLAAGFGLYSVLGLGGDDGPAPVLTADAGPVKEVPEAQPETDAGQSVVFNEISGATPPPEEEQLVSRDQSDGTAIASLPTGDDASEEGLVNRKVRTVTVRPDGTIVGGDEAVAGATQLPVDRPNVPEVPGAEAAATETAAAADPIGAILSDQVPATEAPATRTAAVGEGALTGTPAGNPATTVPTADMLVPGQPATAVDAAGNPIVGRTAPVPMSPIERPSAPTGAPLAVAASPVNALVDPATQRAPISSSTETANPAAAQQQAAAPQDNDVNTLQELFANMGNNDSGNASTATQAPAYVQLSSQRSEEAARQTATNLSNRFGNIFNGTPLEVQRVDLGDRGVYYRVRLPAQSLDSATQICNSVKANGGDCFTL